MKIETAKVSFKAKLIIKKMRNESFKYKENQVIKQLLHYKYVPFDINGVKIDSEFDLEIIELKKAKGYLLKPKAGLHEKVIYQIHGGAYVIPLNESNFKGAYLYSKYTNNSDVFLIDYTVDEKFPRAIEDVCDGYDYLLTKYKNDNISVAGHSAGGGLAMALAFHIREKEIEKPKCLLLASPWLDLTCSGKSYMENRIVDTMFGSLYTQKQINLPNLYADKEYEKNEYASPIFGKFNNLPPILVNTGSDEMVLSDSLSLEEKANAEGSFVKLYVHKGMWHDFYTKTDAFKEAKEVWKNIGLFIENPS